MRKESIVGIVGNETIIGSGVSVKGNLTSEHDIIVDGTISGNIKTKGSLSVGVNANIKGNLIGRDVTVAGQIEGDVKAANHVSIQETGRVNGNIASGSIAISTGGVFIGTSIMTSTPSELQPPADSPDAAPEPEAD
ncbi:MAG TPA: polymer-forming cytoskeletal protein [Candidatus Saccharimonadales bacterium]|nr:polymer-forming cytoskeletal protein [Candidatus Saccharimonadales bacterium]